MCVVYRHSKRHGGSINTASFSPDGKWLVTAGEEGAIRIYNFAEKKLARVLIGNDTGCVGIVWSPDSRMLGVGGYDGIIRLWDVRMGRLKRILSDPSKKGANHLAWSPNGRNLASGSYWNDAIRVWNASTGALVKTAKEETALRSLTWSPDSKHLGCSLAIGGNILLDAISGETKAHLGGVEVSWSQDGERLATADPKANKIKIWENQSWKILKELSVDVVSPGAIAWSPKGKYLAVASDHQGRSRHTTIRVYELETGKLIHKLTNPGMGRIYGHDWSPDGDFISVATGASDSQLRIFNARTGKLVWSVDTMGNEDPVSVFSPDGSNLIVNTQRKTNSISQFRQSAPGFPQGDANYGRPLDIETGKVMVSRNSLEFKSRLKVVCHLVCFQACHNQFNCNFSGPVC